MARKKTRGANVVVPQSREEAVKMVLTVGVKSRLLARIEADMNDELAKIKEAANEKAKPLSDEVVAAIEGLKIWAEAHRSELTRNGRTKTVPLGSGTVKWRNLPPSVSLRKIDDILASLHELDLTKFIRTKEEVNKERCWRTPRPPRPFQASRSSRPAKSSLWSRSKPSCRRTAKRNREGAGDGRSTTHTEAWVVSNGRLLRVHQKGTGVCICGVHRIGAHHGEERILEVKANAALIAAAPELLDALKLARDCIDYCRRSHPDMQSGDGAPVEWFIDAAIAKAEGRGQK
ncbi:hypothetical protein AUC70_11845 [Methyloceanibacter stevinii]|uniref:Uncharacterized protein n=1 Tax=Methyloceanibacter stevinii TaxID=1774970 RepID=A0A1E3VJ55_9HYPH|nr:host-nuclease inhibitor Gam family protein [Methyloceanibacter stevinii]ODR93548.1 hypothetical protein AUC70_11845 [Methyloceanibacter stevinii]